MKATSSKQLSSCWSIELRCTFYYVSCPLMNDATFLTTFTMYSCQVTQAKIYILNPMESDGPMGLKMVGYSNSHPILLHSEIQVLVYMIMWKSFQPCSHPCSHMSNYPTDSQLSDVESIGKAFHTCLHDYSCMNPWMVVYLECHKIMFGSSHIQPTNPSVRVFLCICTCTVPDII